VLEPLELLPSGDPGPHDALLRLQDTKERHRLLRIACRLWRRAESMRQALNVELPAKVRSAAAGLKGEGK